MVPPNTADSDASFSLGVRTYTKKAALFHLPKERMVESSRPARAAAVAAPILKLCPANCSCGSPSAWSAFRTSVTNRGFVNGFPFALKNGPGSVPRATMYAATAVTGHKEFPVRPRYMSAPFPNWSHLDRLRCTLTTVGDSALSTEASPQLRCTASPYEEPAGIRISPDRKNPKKHIDAAAHSSTRCGLSVASQC